jgi:hypothetical protein
MKVRDLREILEHMPDEYVISVSKENAYGWYKKDGSKRTGCVVFLDDENAIVIEKDTAA